MNEHHELIAPTLAEIVEAVETLCEIAAQRGIYHDTPDDYRVTDYQGRQLVAAEITPTTVRLRFGRQQTR